MPACLRKIKTRITENQLHQLCVFARRHSSIYRVFTDQESGGKVDRTEFKVLLLEAYQQKFDLVVFWRLNRFSHEGALATLRNLKKLKDHSVNYKSFTEPYLDSLGLFGGIIVSMRATIAAQDLRKILENPMAALAKKKAASVKLGTPRKNQEQLEQIRRLKNGGMSTYAISKALSISASTAAEYVS